MCQNVALIGCSISSFFSRWCLILDVAVFPILPMFSIHSLHPLSIQIWSFLSLLRMLIVAAISSVSIRPSMWMQQEMTEVVLGFFPMTSASWSLLTCRCSSSPLLWFSKAQAYCLFLNEMWFCLLVLYPVSQSFTMFLPTTFLLCLVTSDFDLLTVSLYNETFFVHLFMESRCVRSSIKSPLGSVIWIYFLSCCWKVAMCTSLFR